MQRARFIPATKWTAWLAGSLLATLAAPPGASAAEPPKPPDLTVSYVNAPSQALVSEPVDTVVEVSELDGDTGAQATVVLTWGQPAALQVPVTVPAGGKVRVTISGAAVGRPLPTRFKATVSAAAPAESDTTNNTRSDTVDVTEHELMRSEVLVPDLGGYGAQFNHHVYAPITNAPAASLPNMERKAIALEPQLVRIFYSDNWEERRADAPANMASFVKTVELAQESGATINITYQAVNVAKAQPAVSMARFADVLENLVEKRGLENVRWVTVGNEPNSTLVTLDEYEALYRALHAQLVKRGLREHLRLMGGDLVEGPVGEPNDHRNWWRFMAERMNDVLDAYSVHMYWRYFDVPRMEFRLRDVHKILTEELPVEARKPTYIMEFGVRGLDAAPGKPTLRFAYWEDGSELRRTNVAAFQQLWFFLESAQLGYTGAAKWDAYWGMYDLSSQGNQVYWMTGSAEEGWPLFPTYHATRLLFQTTRPGSEVVRVAPWADDDWRVELPDQPEKELAAFADPRGPLTVLGLDTRGRLLNTASSESPYYSIGGLPRHTTFTLAVWNGDGTGETSTATTVRTNAVGVARFQVPLQAAFALTTVPVD